MALDIGVARITYGTVLPALRRDFGLTFFAGGALSAVNLAAYLAGTLAAPILARYVSMRALARWGHAAFALGSLMSGAAPDIVTLGLGRILMGGGAGIGLLALFVIVFERTRPDLRSVVSAAVWSGIGLAIVLSGVLAPLLLEPDERWRWAFLVPAGIGVFVAYEVGRVSPAAAPASASSVSPELRFNAFPRRAWVGLFGAYFMFGVGYIAYSTFVGGRLAAASVPMETVVSTWVSLGLGSIAGSVLGAAILWARRWKRLALVLALIAQGLGSAAASSSAGLLPLAGALLVGLGLASTPAIITAYIRERTTDAAYPRLFSLATAALGIGQLVGPVLAGLIADRLGPASVMVFAAAVYAAGAVLALADMVSFRLYAGPVATGVSSREPHSAHEPS